VTDGAEIDRVFGVNRPLCASTGADRLTPPYARIAPAAYRYLENLHVYDVDSPALTTLV
jgi:hypothetical protein